MCKCRMCPLPLVLKPARVAALQPRPRHRLAAAINSRPGDLLLRDLRNHGYEPIVDLMSSMMSLPNKVAQIAKEYRELTEIAFQVLSKPRTEERYRAGCRTDYRRDMGNRAPFEQVSSLVTTPHIHMLCESQGEDRSMSAADDVQERAGEGLWEKSPRYWRDTPNLYHIPGVQPGCTKEECMAARRKIMVRTSDLWIGKKHRQQGIP